MWVQRLSRVVFPSYLPVRRTNFPQIPPPPQYAEKGQYYGGGGAYRMEYVRMYYCFSECYQTKRGAVSKERSESDYTEMRTFVGLSEPTTCLYISVQCFRSFFEKIEYPELKIDSKLNSKAYVYMKFSVLFCFKSRIVRIWLLKKNSSKSSGFKKNSFLKGILSLFANFNAKRGNSGSKNQKLIL